MEHPFLTLFKPLLSMNGDNDAVAYILKHPVLTSPYYTDLLRQWAAGLPPESQGRAEQLIALKLSVALDVRQGKYTIDLPNPIAELSGAVIKGQITLAHAQQVISQPEVFIELMFPAFTMACEAAEQMSVKNWRPAVTIMRILFSALDARGKLVKENQQAMEITSVESWLAVAGRACADVPDGRLFRDAVRRGDVLADLEDRSDPPAPILHRLGVLHLDPYVAGRSSDALDQQLYQWQFRLREEYGMDLAGVSAEALAMPDIDEALPKAAQYFRRAAARRSGEARGRTLKALAQSLFWQGVRELPVDVDECLSCAREALTLLPAAKFPGEQAELRQLMDHLAKTQSASSYDAVAAAKAVMQTPLDDWVRQKGVVETLDLYHQSAGAVAISDPALALRLWMTVDGLIRSRPEAERKTHDLTLIRTLCRFLAQDAPAADGSPVHALAGKLAERAQAGHWPAQKFAYAVLTLASTTTATNQEGDGLQLLDGFAALFEACAGDPIVERVLPVLRAVLRTGDAVNAFDANRFSEAVELYAGAVSANLAAGMPLAALDTLRRILDLATPGKPGADAALPALVATLAENALALELGAGAAATDLVQSSCRFAYGALMAPGFAKPTVLLFILDAAKGRRFRASLDGLELASAWLDDPITLSAEQEMAALGKQAALEVQGTPSVLTENMLLTSYVSASEMHGGATPAERLRNLQIQFDNGLNLNLADAGERQLPRDIETLRALLGDEDVLLIQYIGQNAENVFTLHSLLLSNGEAAGAQAVFPGIPGGAALKLGGDDIEVTANWLSLPVSDLRDQLISPPGPRAADSRALDTLEKELDSYFGGPLKGAMEKFRGQGRNHLCVIPHGPLHFYPFHLLGAEDEPLAAKWCVTYLPNLALLGRQVNGGAKAVEMTAIGINFTVGNGFGLAPLAGCEDEAGAVAAASASPARLLVGDDAHKAAVLQAFGQSRRVHIATHGKHNVSAPFFQCFYLNAGPDDERIIYAYELLRLDLKGLDLVTFSACETALGRVDAADNLRGIPAALLMAGVSTIVGTLWNVESATATHFFGVFYKILKEQGSKRAAFQGAQTDTRGAFPKYRDWGAFQLIGAWT
jgi:hypothetical protein